MYVYIGTASFGALLILLVLAAVSLRSGFDEFQQNVLRTVLALGCGLVAVLVPGEMDAHIPDNGPLRAGINIAGPMSIFFMVFFFFKPAAWLSTADPNRKKDTRA